MRSLIEGRRWLKTYGSLFAIHSETGTDANYPRLHVVKEFLDVF